MPMVRPFTSEGLCLQVLWNTSGRGRRDSPGQSNAVDH